MVLLKDGQKELIESYPNSFSTFAGSELKQLANSEENIDYKKLSQEIFFDGFSFFKRYSKPYILLNNLVTNKINIDTVNDNQRNFVFDLMKGYNLSSFFSKSEARDLNNRNLYERSKRKASGILLKCEKSTEGIKAFLPRRFKKDINENQKSVSLNAIMKFDIRNAIANLFRNGFIKPLQYQSATKLKPKPKSERTTAERTKLRRQRLDEIAGKENEIARKEKTTDFQLFRYYFKYPSPSDMYKELDGADTENNEVKVNFIKNYMTDQKK